MIQEITIRPIGGGERMTTLFSWKYFDKEKNQNITIANVGGTRYVAIVDRPLTDTEKLFKVWFGENQRDITLRWDDEKDKKTGEAITAIQRHPQVQTPGQENPNRLGTPLFEFIDSRKQSTQKVLALKEKGVVFNMTNNMTIDELMDISFFVG